MEKPWEKGKARHQADLLKVFNFNCSCKACSLTGEDLIASDLRRARFGGLFRTRQARDLLLTYPRLAMWYYREMLRVLDEEGESDMKACSFFYDTFIISLAMEI